MTDRDRTDERRALDDFANTDAQPNQPLQPQQRPPHGQSLVRPTTGLAERVIGAQPVAVYRDDARVMQKLSQLAAGAGDDWFYRFPVKKKDGGVEYIEGPSIKLANAVLRLVGNVIVETREVDVGDANVFYCRITDIENGASLERAFRQRKSQMSLKTKDADRQQDIAYAIGQSKAIRNAIVNFLQTPYVDHAFEEARNSLVDKIGRDVDGWRQRTLDGLARIPVDVKRVERVLGRATKDWLAPDIARVIAMGKAISDGMATVDETFPPLPAAVEKPTAASTSPDAATSAPAGESEPKPETKTEQAAATKPKADTAKSKPAPKTAADYLVLVATTAHEATDIEALRTWYAGDEQRRLRTTVSLSAEESNQARKIVEERVTELRKGQ